MKANTSRLLILISILVLGVPASAAADTVYVTGRISPLFAEAGTGASRLAMLKQGDELEVLATDGDWVQVQTAQGTKGWLQSMFVGEEPSAQTVSRAAGLSNVSTVATRRRASAYSTSAAATRGLSADDVRSRENLAFSDYDFDAIEWLTGFTYTEEEVLSFAQKQGVLAQ